MKSKLVVIAVLLLIITSFLVAGCTQQTTTQSSNGSATETGGITATAKAVTMPAIQHTVTPNPGNKYMAYNCSVTNVNAKDRSISYMYWTLRDAQGNVYTPSWFPGDATAINQFDGARSQPGDVVKGLVVFNVPQTIQPKSLTYDDGQSKIVVTL